MEKIYSLQILQTVQILKTIVILILVNKINGQEASEEYYRRREIFMPKVSPEWQNRQRETTPLMEKRQFSFQDRFKNKESVNLEERNPTSRTENGENMDQGEQRLYNSESDQLPWQRPKTQMYRNFNNHESTDMLRSQPNYENRFPRYSQLHEATHIKPFNDGRSRSQNEGVMHRTTIDEYQNHNYSDIFPSQQMTREAHNYQQESTANNYRNRHEEFQSNPDLNKHVNGFESTSALYPTWSRDKHVPLNGRLFEDINPSRSESRQLPVAMRQISSASRNNNSREKSLKEESSENENNKNEMTHGSLETFLNHQGEPRRMPAFRESTDQMREAPRELDQVTRTNISRARFLLEESSPENSRFGHERRSKNYVPRSNLKSSQWQQAEGTRMSELHDPVDTWHDHLDTMKDIRQDQLEASMMTGRASPDIYNFRQTHRGHLTPDMVHSADQWSDHVDTLHDLRQDQLEASLIHNQRSKFTGRSRLNSNTDGNLKNMQSETRNVLHGNMNTFQQNHEIPVPALWEGTNRNLQNNERSWSPSAMMEGTDTQQRGSVRSRSQTELMEGKERQQSESVKSRAPFALWENQESESLRSRLSSPLWESSNSQESGRSRPSYPLWESSIRQQSENLSSRPTFQSWEGANSENLRSRPFARLMESTSSHNSNHTEKNGNENTKTNSENPSRSDMMRSNVPKIDSGMYTRQRIGNIQTDTTSRQNSTAHSSGNVSLLHQMQNGKTNSSWEYANQDQIQNSRTNPLWEFTGEGQIYKSRSWNPSLEATAESYNHNLRRNMNLQGWANNTAIADNEATSFSNERDQNWMSNSRGDNSTAFAVDERQHISLQPIESSSYPRQHNRFMNPLIQRNNQEGTYLESELHGRKYNPMSYNGQESTNQNLEANPYLPSRINRYQSGKEPTSYNEHQRPRKWPQNVRDFARMHGNSRTVNSRNNPTQNENQGSEAERHEIWESTTRSYEREHRTQEPEREESSNSEQENESSTTQEPEHAESSRDRQRETERSRERSEQERKSGSAQDHSEGRYRGNSRHSSWSRYGENTRQQTNPGENTRIRTNYGENSRHKTNYGENTRQQTSYWYGENTEQATNFGENTQQQRNYGQNSGQRTNYGENTRQQTNYGETGHQENFGENRRGQVNYGSIHRSNFEIQTPNRQREFIVNQRESFVNSGSKFNSNIESNPFIKNPRRNIGGISRENIQNKHFTPMGEISNFKNVPKSPYDKNQRGLHIINAGFETTTENMTSVRPNSTEKLLQVDPIKQPTSNPTSPAFGIIVGVTIGFIVILAPIICLLCKLKKNRASKKVRLRSASDTNIEENSMMEAMILSDLGRGSEPMTEIKYPLSGHAINENINCNAVYANNIADKDHIKSYSEPQIHHAMIH